MKLTYPACFYKDDESDAYGVEVPDLPGCASGGKDLTEAILMATDAASGWILGELEDGQPIPKPSAPHEIKPEDGGFVSLLVLDMDEYAKNHGNEAVRKEITVPAWINTFAQTRHIDYSQLVQQQIAEMYAHHHP
ncbi:MAG: type II toxin-antitoxin system HicB family antitoxin [Holophagaceae bacterium]|nr:type II toxin-antitoxin system HicB family antitoxin [Holophagaceae bacterium]